MVFEAAVYLSSYLFKKGIFWEKWFQKFSGIWVKFFQLSATFLQHGRRKCNLRLQRNILGDVFLRKCFSFILIFRCFPKKSENSRKISAWFSKLQSTVPEEHFSGIFLGENFNVLSLFSGSLPKKRKTGRKLWQGCQYGVLRAKNWIFLEIILGIVILEVILGTPESGGSSKLPSTLPEDHFEGRCFCGEIMKF